MKLTKRDLKISIKGTNKAIKLFRKIYKLVGYNPNLISILSEIDKAKMDIEKYKKQLVMGDYVK